MKKFLLLIPLILGCGSNTDTKSFFKNVCEKSKVSFSKVDNSEKEETKPKAESEATPEETGYCTENEKQKILDDYKSKQEARFIEYLAERNMPPTPAKIQASLEDANERCAKLIQCSGLSLEVAVPKGFKLYRCGMKNGENWIEIDCSYPEDI